MGWAEQLPSGKWRGVYRDSVGKRKSAGTYVRKSDAVRAAGSKEDETRKSSKPTSDLTWAEWEPVWWSSRTVSPGTKQRNQSAIEGHIRPKWGTTKISDITTGDVQQWVTEMCRDKNEGGAGVAPNTSIKNYFILSGSLRAAVQAGLIDKNPCSGIDLPPAGPMPERFLTDAEAEALRKSMPNDLLGLLFDVLLGSGMRLGEALGLHWENVNLDAQTITVAWSWDREIRNFKPPKNHQKRTIPIGNTVTKLLRERLDEQGYGKPPSIVYRGSGSKPHTGLVFAYVDGKPIDDAKFRATFDAAVRVTYLGHGKKRKHIGHVRPHDLRHTYASWLAQSGVPIQQIAKLLGHADLATVQRYADLAQTQWDSVRKVLG